MSKKIKVLIVEDQFILFQELYEFFEEKGFEIVCEDKEKAVDNYADALILLNKYKPDIAVVDIKIKGDKDGIDIGAYVKEHYHIPVIYLSAYPSPGNLERIRNIGDKRFVFKATKPLDKNQLWAVFYLALNEITISEKEKTIGRIYSVKKVDLKRSGKDRLENYELLDLKVNILWDDIVFFRSYNASSSDGNNNIIICLRNGKAYSTRQTIIATEQEIPDYFVRIDKSTIINIKCITAIGRSNSFCMVEEETFLISEKYRKSALEKIKLYMRTDS